MTSCCRAGPCEQMFGPKAARRGLERYRKKGLDEIERRMLASLSVEEVEGASVLEIGGGFGALQAELLGSGAERGEIVELVPAWEPYARELARERGLEQRSSFRVADVLDDPEAVQPAAIVVLNRVVCCSPDGVALAGVAARLAERRLVLSFPRSTLLVRVGVRVMNGCMRMLRRSFRVFVHPTVALVAAAENEGLQLAGDGHGRLWEFASFRRA